MHSPGAVYALETIEPGADAVWKPIPLEHGQQSLAALQEARLRTPLHVLPKSCKKPCPAGLDQVLHDFQVLPCETLFTGDNLQKDGLADVVCTCAPVEDSARKMPGAMPEAALSTGAIAPVWPDHRSGR